MKKVFLILFLLTATLSFSQNFWNGKKFVYQSLSSTETFQGTIVFLDDNSMAIQIGDSSAQFSKYKYLWNQKSSVMRVGQTEFLFVKIDSHTWHMIKIDDDSEKIESFTLLEKYK